MRDIVVEFARNRSPQAVCDTQNLVTMGHRIHEGSDRAHIEYLFEVHALALHLLPDAVDVLWPPGQLHRNADIGALSLEAFDDVSNKGLTFPTLAVQLPGKAGVLLGLKT